MSAEELDYWYVFGSQEPLPYQQIVFMLAQLTALLGNAFRGKDGRTVTAKDFLPQYWRQRQTVEEMLKLAALLTMESGGEVAPHIWQLYSESSDSSSMETTPT